MEMSGSLKNAAIDAISEGAENFCFGRSNYRIYMEPPSDRSQLLFTGVIDFEGKQYGIYQVRVTP